MSLFDFLGYESPLLDPMSISPLRLSMQKSGDEIRIYASNTGKNIIIIKLIILHMDHGPSTESIYWLRKDDFFFKKEEVEQGWNGLIYKDTFANVTKAQCWAEYIEVIGRAKSKEYTY